MAVGWLTMLSTFCGGSVDCSWRWWWWWWWCCSCWWCCSGCCTCSMACPFVRDGCVTTGSMVEGAGGGGALGPGTLGAATLLPLYCVCVCVDRFVCDKFSDNNKDLRFSCLYLVSVYEGLGLRDKVLWKRGLNTRQAGDQHQQLAYFFLATFLQQLNCLEHAWNMVIIFHYGLVITIINLNARI